MTILEAWRYGNPCLVTKGTNVMDEVIAEALGWGTELESEKIANALLLAKNDYANARELYIRRCKTYVKNTYSWEQIALASFHKLSEICDKGE